MTIIYVKCPWRLLKNPEEIVLKLFCEVILNPVPHIPESLRFCDRKL